MCLTREIQSASATPCSLGCGPSAFGCSNPARRQRRSSQAPGAANRRGGGVTRRPRSLPPVDPGPARQIACNQRGTRTNSTRQAACMKGSTSMAPRGTNAPLPNARAGRSCLPYLLIAGLCLDAAACAKASVDGTKRDAAVGDAEPKTDASPGDQGGRKDGPAPDVSY